MPILPASDLQRPASFSGLDDNAPELEKYSTETVPTSTEQSCSMDEIIWRLFPDHVVERVLPWLPLPSIVRSQLVCKSWNSMIKNSRLFSDIYSQVEHEPWFLVFNNENEGLTYDPKENKWMRLSFSFLPVESRAVATADGLICMVPKTSNASGLYICNPILKLWRELPRPPGLFKFFFFVAGLIVERNLRSYKVVLAGSELVCGDVGQIVLMAEVYDSRTNSWMRSRSFPFEAPVYPWRAISHGVLYCVTGQAPWNIIGFNVHNGAWLRVRASMPSFLTSVKLMDHKGMLIMIGGLGNSGITEKIGIWELNEAGTEWTKVGGLPREFCGVFLKSLSRRFACVGHGNLIYFTGKKCSHMLLYDLSCRIWRWMVCCPEISDPHSYIFNGFCFQPRLDMSI